MRKTLKLLAASAALLATPMIAISAHAQQSGALAEQIGAVEVSAMLQELGIATQKHTDTVGGSPSLVATTSGGAKFLIGFFECADTATPSGCKQIMVTTAQASGGIAFEDLNMFNGQASVTTVVYEPTNQILIFGRNIFMPGGIGRENFKLQIALFLSDMQTFVEGRRTGAKSVAFSKQPELKSKITSIAADESAPVKAFSISADRSAEVEIAIANTVDLDYSAPTE